MHFFDLLVSKDIGPIWCILHIAREIGQEAESLRPKIPQIVILNAGKFRPQ